MAEFADFDRILRQPVSLVHGVYWKRVRFFFYRPVLPFQECMPGTAVAPWPGLMGGFQHAVPSTGFANSFLNYLMFDNARNYSLENLDYNRKRQVRLAMKQFEIRPVSNLDEFKKEAYAAYLSFFERTQYQYASGRRDRNFFCQWADDLFKINKGLVLGGYHKGALRGVSISSLVDDTLCYSTFFCDTDSMRMGLSDLMLHSVRQAVADKQCAGQIFAGMYKGGKSLDDFYLLRGCKLVRKPALLHLNPLAAFVLRCFFPGYFARLKGEIQDSDLGKIGSNKITGHNGMNRKSNTPDVVRETTKDDMFPAMPGMVAVSNADCSRPLVF